MVTDQVKKVQLAFYQSGGAGCLFLAHAARNPAKYGWELRVVENNTVKELSEIIQESIASNWISTQSIIFPRVDSYPGFKSFLRDLQTVPEVVLEQSEEFNDYICLGYRIKIGQYLSWVTGFGPFGFLPKTRQAPYTEITFRTKPRPDYKVVMKEAPKNVLHLADMDMKGMKKAKFQAMWTGSFTNTEKVLGHKPDLCSAAKTTFSIPK